MSRPVYESAKDRWREREVADLIAGSERVAVKLPLSYRLDFAMCNPDGPKSGELALRAIRSFVEVKCRSRVWDMWFIAASKLVAAREYQRLGIPCYFAWAVKDEEGWRVALWDVADATDLVFVMAGRNDRKDAADIEPLAMIPDANCIVRRL